MKPPRLAVLIAAVLTVGAFGALPSSGANVTGKLVLAKAPFEFAFGTGSVLDAVSIGLDACVPLEPILGCFPSQPLEVAVSEQSGGTTVWQDVSDASFAAVAGRLTNGQNDRVVLTIGESGSGRLETEFFGSAAGPNGVDLHGATIERIGVRVHEARISTPGQNPNGDGKWTDIRLSGVLVFEGYVESGKYCHGGRWQKLERPDGTSFSSQSDCTKYVKSGR